MGLRGSGFLSMSVDLLLLHPDIFLDQQEWAPGPHASSPSRATRLADLGTVDGTPMKYTHNSSPRVLRCFRLASPSWSPTTLVYGLQPHNISPNSVLAISNHVTLCEGHLRVTPELSLFQYYFTVKKERIRNSTELATCGSITFMIRPGRVYPHTDRHESARYWSGGFFYLKDVSDPRAQGNAAFKNRPPLNFRLGRTAPPLEAPLTRRKADLKLTEEGLTGKDLTLPGSPSGSSRSNRDH
ncbi:hypothetical protein QYE76_046330 [Lolium multiflorum]|uniref:Transposase (putative) gypsy type domain-containing protein n=1 Tax=Lolium multiflorum TaxID=4521 RepID=A0AAD8TPK2_LOLMU|nr:hypothetical protein QYE76_046330 [Lolium multiflorum]